MAEESILKTMKRAIELAMPDLRHYYRMTKKAKVVTSYASDGKYYADIQPLRNDGTEDPDEPVIPRVEIPVLWGGPKRGIVCPPAVGTFCDLSYYDGDPHYPFISNIRWGLGNDAPVCELNELVIQLEPGVEIRIDREKKIVTLTPESVRTEAGKDWTVKAENTAVLEAPQIILKGGLSCQGGLSIEGNLAVSGNSSVSGNAHASTRSGGPI